MSAFAFGVLLDINGFHSYTKNSNIPELPLVDQFDGHI